MKKIILKGIRISLIIILLIITILIVSNPLIKTEEGIKRDMLKATPIGTSMKDVVSAIDENKIWEIDVIDNDYGYGIDEEGWIGDNNPNTIGEINSSFCKFIWWIYMDKAILCFWQRF